jgi:hypothetical protein
MQESVGNIVFLPGKQLRVLLDALGMGIGAIGVDCIAVGAGVAGCHLGVGLFSH